MDLNSYYSKNYSNLRSRGAIGQGHRTIHQKLESKISRKVSLDKVIELGAGSGQHFEFVSHPFKEYFETDLRLENLPQRLDVRVKQLAIDATNLSQFSDNYFDRIIATCLVIHLSDPEMALSEWRRVAKNNSTLSIYVHCEPGLLLRALRALSISKASRKLGLDHYAVIYRDHVTYFPRVDFLIKEIFQNDYVRRDFWPCRFPFWNLNIGVFYRITVKKI